MKFGNKFNGVAKLYLILEALVFVMGVFLLFNSQSYNNQKSLTKIPNTSITNLSFSNDNLINTYLVTRVIDGDTIEIEGGKKVRYLGIDTPESVDPRKPIQCFGIEASKKNQELVLGKRVRLEKDISEIDKYGRLLRYVYVDNIFVNDYLVRNGYAHVATYPPDVKYQEQFLEAQKEARENKRGLWNSCPLSNTSNFSQNQSTSSITSLPNNCVIKGNINSNGEKIYHLPECSSYEQTKIDEARGERWFCTEEEAKANGFRKASNCP